MIDKNALIEKALEILEAEVESIRLTIKNTEREIKEAPGAMKSHSDTTKSQKEGLMVGFTKQFGEKQKSLMQLRRINRAAMGKIVSGSLVEVKGEKTGKCYLYFIIPGGGGNKVTISDKTIMLISPNSAIAIGLLGHKVGDSAKCEIPNGTIRLRVVSIF